MSSIVVFLSIFTIVFGSSCDRLYYDSYYGTKLTEEEYNLRVKKNTTFWCTNVLKLCNPNDWRRVDGSCNNLNHPNRGMTHTPTLRLLPATFSGDSEKGYEPRKAKDGGALPAERNLRTSIMPQGRAPDQVFTQLVTHFAVFLVSDVINVHDSVNLVQWKPYCCLPQGAEDEDCIPVKIPDDDPVHRFSNRRCLPLTKPLTYQSEGCLMKNTVPERIVSSSPTLDLSDIYGRTYELLASKGRLFKGGLLKYDLLNGKMWPPSLKSTSSERAICVLNKAPVETRCHDTPDPVTNSLLGINIHSIWFWRLHNRIATALAKINPCWDDDTLLYTTRDICIAYMAQLVHYEYLPTLMGYDNLLREGVVSPTPGFRDAYNEKLLPQVSSEYLFILRWFHIIQENEQRMYDAKGHYLRSVHITNVTLRTGYLACDKNLEHITQGMFRQAGGSFDNLVDPDVAEYALGPMTSGTDATTFDIVKNRYFGLPPYVKYLELCNKRPFKSFDDLIGFTKPSMLDIIKDKYKNVEDIDLIVGLWTELPAVGSYLPKTMHCLMVDQHLRFMESDRHWYERSDRPHAFDLAQLFEIRKASMARLICDVGDSVSEIQPNPFLRPGRGNEIQSCEIYEDMDVRAWKDSSCDVDCSYQHSGINDHEGNPFA